MDPSNLLAATGVLGLFAATSTVLYRMMKRDERMAVMRDKEQARLEDLNRRCDRRVTILIQACQRGGIEIPEDVWL